MEENKVLAKRMYFFVPYNISEIAKGIQAGHAALEYARKFSTTDLFKEFVSEHKTWIILNGGTTNDQRDFEGIAQGTLNQIADQLQENDIPFSFFREPDLNDALTALCFIVDERVFNTVDYPSFDEFIQNKVENDGESIFMGYDAYLNEYDDLYGEKTRFLKELILTKKLA